MRAGTFVRRFLLPAPAVTALCWFKFGCMASHRAEIDLSEHLKIGKKTQIGSYTKIKSTHGPLTIGERVLIGPNVFISSESAGVHIGDYCMVSAGSAIIGSGYRYDDLETPICMQEITSLGIHIEPNVWLGVNSVVLDGAHIGTGTIVAPNSVVSGRIPENSIVQGNPARIIFERR